MLESSCQDPDIVKLDWLVLLVIDPPCAYFAPLQNPLLITFTLEPMMQFPKFKLDLNALVGENSVNY